MNREDLLKRFAEVAPKEFKAQYIPGPTVKTEYPNFGSFIQEWITLNNDRHDAPIIIRILDQLESEGWTPEIRTQHNPEAKYACRLDSHGIGGYETKVAAGGPTRGWAILAAAVEAWGN